MDEFIDKCTDSNKVMNKHDMKSDDYNNLKSMFYSSKFFFIQINDICDLSTVLGLIFILKYSQIAFFAGLTDKAFIQYASLSGVETALELVYTLITPMIIRRFTKYKYFYPSVGGKDMFFK